MAAACVRVRPPLSCLVLSAAWFLGGAPALAGVDLTPPSISYTPLGDTQYTPSRTLSTA